MLIQLLLPTLFPPERRRRNVRMRLAISPPAGTKTSNIKPWNLEESNVAP
jgi:hypothetical protein